MQRAGAFTVSMPIEPIRKVYATLKGDPAVADYHEMLAVGMVKAEMVLGDANRLVVVNFVIFEVKVDIPTFSFIASFTYDS